MKKVLNFWESLEHYAWKVVARSPLPRLQQLCCKRCGQAWPYVALGLMGAVLLASLLNVKSSVVGAENIQEVIEKAASLGDYETARKLYESCAVSQCQSDTDNVLGADSELEDKVYPKKVVERRIAELEEKLAEYPENKELYLEISRLHRDIGSEARALEYWERARVLDPNGSEFR